VSIEIGAFEDDIQLIIESFHAEGVLTQFLKSPFSQFVQAILDGFIVFDEVAMD
jgi:hypothetical protein